MNAHTNRPTWKTLRFASVLQENTTQNSFLDELNALQFRFGDIVPKKRFEIDEALKETYKKYTIVEPNDIMINGLNLNYDFVTQRVAIVKQRGIITSAYISVRPRTDVNASYYCYLLKSLDAIKLLNGMGTGIRLTLSYALLKNMRLPIPPRSEQDQIVRYLDWQVSKIKKLIAAKKREIELLEERRDNKIESIVLHGLGHTANLQDEIVHDYTCFPTHWQVIQNKRLFSERVEHTKTGTEPLLSVSKHYGVKPCTELTEDEQFATIKPALSLIGYKVVKKNDMAMNIMRARNGSYGISDFDGIVSPAYCVYQLTQRCNARYIHYLLRTKHVKSLFEAYSTGIAEHRRRLYSDDFLRLYTLLPPEYEQEAIVVAVEQANTETEAVTNSFQRQIDVLHDLRARLISDVVTGQIDVHSIEIPDFEMVEETNTDEADNENEVAEETEGQEDV